MNNDNDIFEYRINGISRLIKKSLSSAIRAHEILFNDTDTKQNEIISALYLNKSISFMAAAESVYVSDYEMLMRNEIEEIFQAFHTFEVEFLNNISTDHSHQWTDIEFNAFKETVESFIN